MSGRHDGAQLHKSCQGNVLRQAWKVIKHVYPPVQTTQTVCGPSELCGATNVKAAMIIPISLM